MICWKYFDFTDNVGDYDQLESEMDDTSKHGDFFFSFFAIKKCKLISLA